MGATPTLGAPPPSWAPRKAVDALLWPQESYFLEKDLGEGFNPIGVMDLHILRICISQNRKEGRFDEL